MEKKKKRARIGTIVLLVVLVLIAALLAVLPRLVRSAAADDGAIIVQGMVEQNALVRSATGGGVLETEDAAVVKVHPGVKVTELRIALGDTVTEGQVLATVDKVSVMSAISSIQKTMETLTLQLQYLGIRTTNITVDDDGVLYADGNEVKNENIVKYAQYLTLSDEHRYCEERLRELFAMYQSGILTAPAAGLIGSLDKTVCEPLAFESRSTADAASPRDISVHEYVALNEADTLSAAPASSTAEAVGWGGHRMDDSIEPELFGEESRTLCEIIPMETVHFTVSVAEQDVPGIETEMLVEVLLDALPGEVREGRITEVGKFGSATSGSSKFAVTIELPADEKMLPGMNATAVFLLETRKNALTVPVAALSERDGKTVVYTGCNKESGTLTDPAEVTLGFSDGESVEVLSGLKRGQVIYYEAFE